eukprot:scaffold495085_cov34-Prasinocladus_malaysianus.AAC.1
MLRLLALSPICNLQGLQSLAVVVHARCVPVIPLSTTALIITSFRDGSHHLLGTADQCLFGMPASCWRSGFLMAQQGLAMA